MKSVGKIIFIIIWLTSLIGCGFLPPSAAEQDEADKFCRAIKRNPEFRLEFEKADVAINGTAAWPSHEAIFIAAFISKKIDIPENIKIVIKKEALRLGISRKIEITFFEGKDVMQGQEFQKITIYPTTEALVTDRIQNGLIVFFLILIVGCICWRWVRKLHSKRKGATVASSLNITLGQKQRQGCLTAFLVLMIIFYANAFLFFFVRNSVHIFANPNHLNQEALPGLPPAALPVLLILPLCYLISAIALFRWKKWGFWMCAATAVADCLIYLWFGDYSDSVLAGVVPLALYGVLHIGTETKGWTQLD